MTDDPKQTDTQLQSTSKPADSSSPLGDAVEPRTTAEMSSTHTPSDRGGPTRPSVPPYLTSRQFNPYISPVIPFLKRLAFVLSLALGSAAIGAWVWSTFLLPLLHASFSARKALADQQKDRMDSLLQSLKMIRSRRIYPSLRSEDPAKPEGRGEVSHEQRPLEASSTEEDRLLPVEESDRTSQASSSRLSAARDSITLVPLKDLSALSSTLADLSSALDSTSTTRTSLLSTLEMYTSQLQRDVFLRSSRPNPSVGLNTLSQNLDRERGHSADEGRSEEWREARKEIRAMKGILLGRRNFASATTVTQPS